MSNELSEFRHRAAIQSRGQSHSRIHAFVTQLIEQVESLSPSSSDRSILDVGAGTGEFLNSELVKSRFRIRVGVDIERHGASEPLAITWLQCDLNERWNNISDASFDCVAAIETIEHLENPRHFIRECARVLKPGGYLVLTTPNNESVRSLLSLIFRGHFVDFLDTNYPAHLTPLLSVDLKRMVMESGLKLVKQGYSQWGTLPFFTSLDWQKMTIGLLRGKRFSDQIFTLAGKNL